MTEAAQAIFEYARRGRMDDLLEYIDTAHPDEYVAYDGSTAFLIACKNGHTTVSEFLISKGADVSLRVDDGSTALLLAVSTGKIDLVCLLLKLRVCDLNESNEDGFTPLALARHYGHTEIIALLEFHGAELGATPSIPDSGEFICGPTEKWGYGVFD